MTYGNLFIVLLDYASCDAVNAAKRAMSDWSTK